MITPLGRGQWVHVENGAAPSARGLLRSLDLMSQAGGLCRHRSGPDLGAEGRVGRSSIN